jgi:hypothetical protein
MVNLIKGEKKWPVYICDINGESFLRVAISPSDPFKPINA